MCINENGATILACSKIDKIFIKSIVIVINYFCLDQYKHQMNVSYRTSLTYKRAISCRMTSVIIVIFLDFVILICHSLK